MVKNDEVRATEALCDNIVTTRFEDFDAQTVELAKYRIIDILGCVIGGANAPGNKALIDLVRGQGGKEESTLMVYGDKMPSRQAAMLNAVMARSYDFEVMAYVLEGKFFPSHHAATVVPTALALAEKQGASGKELLTAMLVGDDMAARVQAASAGHPISLGWDGCATLSHIGATATASRLLGLDRQQTKNAFGIALNLIAGTIQNYWDGSPTFKLGQGTAASHGIFSAELAKSGWTGVDDALLSRYGYFFLYGGGCSDPSILTTDLGKKYHGEAYFKPYPSGMPTHSAIEAALAIARENDIKTADIEEVIIHAPHGSLANSYYAKPFFVRSFPQGDAAFSYIYTVATALLYKSVGLLNFTEESINDTRITRIVAKTRIVERPAGAEIGIQVDINMKDSRKFSQYKAEPRDWAVNPIPKEWIKAKFRQQVDFSKTISRSRVGSILEQAENLDEVENVYGLVKLLVV